MNPKRIAFVETGHGRGGSAISLLRILKSLRKNHAEKVSPLVFGIGQEGVALFAENGFETVALQPGTGLGNFFAMRNKLAEYSVDLLHCNNTPYGSVAFMLAARSMGIPVTTHFRCSRNITRREIFAFRRLVAHSFTVSRAGRDIILRQAKIPNCSVTMLGDGITPEDYHVTNEERKSARAELDVGENDFVVLLPATLQPGKGQDTALEAAAQMKCEKNVLWLFPGEEHYQFPGFRIKLNETICERKLQDNVRLLGHRNDMPRLFAACDIVILPSRLTEGLPCSIMEAMAAGKAIVASDTGGIAESVDEEVGMLVEAGNAVQLRDAVTRLAEAGELLRKLGVCAAARAEERFSIHRITENLLDYFPFEFDE